MQTSGYQQGDLGGALSQVFIEIDDLLLQPGSAEELAALRDGARGAPLLEI